MRHSLRILGLGLMLAGAASALTVDEVITLSRAGVADATIVAQIESDGSRFVLDADQILRLRRLGVSDTVLAAMIRTQRAATDTRPLGGQVIAPGDPAEREAFLDAPDSPSLTDRRRAEPATGETRSSIGVVVEAPAVVIPPYYGYPGQVYTYPYQPPRITYQLGPNRPLFVYGEPGVYNYSYPYPTYRPPYYNPRPSYRPPYGYDPKRPTYGYGGSPYGGVGGKEPLRPGGLGSYDPKREKGR